MAPEIFQGAHGVASEWWSFGVSLHDFMAGRLPVKSTKGLTYNPSSSRMKSGKESKDLVSNLLQIKPGDRLTAEQIKSHLWFSDVDWAKAAARQIQPPYLPDCSKANCSTGTLDVMNQLGADDEVLPQISAEQDRLFVDYQHNIKVIESDSN